MKPQKNSSSELLLLPDGRILVHNVTPEMAALLCQIDPENRLMKRRAGEAAATEAKNDNHEIDP